MWGFQFPARRWLMFSLFQCIMSWRQHFWSSLELNVFLLPSSAVIQELSFLFLLFLQLIFACFFFLFVFFYDIRMFWPFWIRNYYWVISTAKRYAVVLSFGTKRILPFGCISRFISANKLGQELRTKKIKKIHLNIRNYHWSMKLFKQSNLAEQVKAASTII